MATLNEMQVKWPREQFDRLGAEGLLNPAATYEQYLELRLEQAEMAEEAARLGWTGDDPPELTAADEAILDRVWAQLRTEREALAQAQGA